MTFDRTEFFMREHYFGDLALKVTAEALASGDIELSGKVDLSALDAPIKAAAARLAAKHCNPNYENERVIGMAHGNLLQPNSAVNDLCDEIEWKVRASTLLERYADKLYKGRHEAA